MSPSVREGLHLVAAADLSRQGWLCSGRRRDVELGAAVADEHQRSL